MTRLQFILILGLSLTAFASTENASTDSYTGYAYEKGNTVPVYTEEFTDTFVRGLHTETTTNYFDAAGKLIVRRKINYSNSKFAPDFKTEDLRTGYMEGAELHGSQFRLFVRKDKNSPIDEKLVDVPQPVVVDGGFNQFIKAHWNDLRKDQPLTFYFTVSSRLDYFKLRAVKIEETASSMKVKIEPDRAFIRWMASPIVVEYDLKTKRILSYEGKSNIADENGSNFIVKLIYPEKGP